MSWGANEWAAVGGILSAIATAASAYYAAVAAKGSQEASENAQQQIKIAEESRKIQILPHVVIHSIPDTLRHYASFLVVENVGPGAALDVEINVLSGEDHEIMHNTPLKSWGPIRDGIAVLPSGVRLQTELGTLNETEYGVNFLLETEFSFSLLFSDIEGKRYGPIVFNLNKNPLQHTVYTESDDHLQARHLERIANTLQQAERKLR